MCIHSYNPHKGRIYYYLLLFKQMKLREISNFHNVWLQYVVRQETEFGLLINSNSIFTQSLCLLAKSVCLLTLNITYVYSHNLKEWKLLKVAEENGEDKNWIKEEKIKGDIEVIEGNGVMYVKVFQDLAIFSQKYFSNLESLKITIYTVQCQKSTGKSRHLVLNCSSLSLSSSFQDFKGIGQKSH